MKKLKFVTKTIAFLSIFLFVSLSSCTDEKGAKKTLMQSGFHPIEVRGYGWFNGSKDDMFITKFKAYSADSSMIVTGVVTSGWFKGGTIRLD